MKRTKSLIINDDVIINWENVNSCTVKISKIKKYYSISTELNCGLEIAIIINYKNKNSEKVTVLKKKMRIPEKEMGETQAYKSRIEKSSSSISSMIVLSEEIAPAIKAFKKFKIENEVIFKNKKEEILNIIKKMSSDNNYIN